MKKNLGYEIKNLLMIAAAALIYAVGISLFLDPNQLAPGGVTGIAVILNRLTNIETGTLYFLLNVPIDFWAFGNLVCALLQKRFMRLRWYLFLRICWVIMEH